MEINGCMDSDPCFMLPSSSGGDDCVLVSRRSSPFGPVDDRSDVRLRPYLKDRAAGCGPQRRRQNFAARFIFDAPYWRRRVDITLLYTIAVINLVLLEWDVYDGIIPKQVTFFEWIVTFWVFLLGIAYSYLQERFNSSLISYAVNMLTNIVAFAANVEPSLKQGNLNHAVSTFSYTPLYARGCAEHKICKKESTFGCILQELQHIMRALPYAAGVSFRGGESGGIDVQRLPLPEQLKAELQVLLCSLGSYLKAMIDMARSRVSYLKNAKVMSRQVQITLLELLNSIEMNGAETEYRNTASPMSAFLRQLLSLAIYPSLIYLPFVTYRELGFVLSLILLPYALIVLLGADELLNTLYDPFDPKTDIINIGMDVSVWTRRAASAVDQSFDLLLDKLSLTTNK